MPSDGRREPRFVPAPTTAERAFLVCATPRSGSTLVCQALRKTGVAGRPEEYFEALLHSGRPRRPEEYFIGVDDTSILDHLGERGIAEDPRPRSPLWSRAAYDRYLEWAIETGTTPNGVFSAKLMWGYFGDFVSLLRNIPPYRDLPLAELLPAVFPDLTFVRVVRANKIRQAVSLWKAVQTATWREEDARKELSLDDIDEVPDSPPYRSFLEDHRPQLRFHYRAIAHLLDQILLEEASWDAFFEHCGVRPLLVLYENFAADPQASTLSILNRLELPAPADMSVAPRMRRQSDGINDDWVRRFSELRLGTEFDLVPAVPQPVQPVAHFE
jgi:trehalose 2-sulfotransferase